MKYILLWSVLSVPQAQVGPFNNVFACELAASQVKLIAAKPQHIRAVCINIDAKPHHWNGKALPK